MGFYTDKKLKQRAQFDTVFANRKCKKGTCFRIFWATNNLESSRLGISIPKKNIPKAVSRNKIKRLIKESFRLNYNCLPGVDIVLVVNKNANDLSAEYLCSELSTKWLEFAKYNNTHITS